MTNVFLANLAIDDISVGIFCVLPNLSTFLQPNWVHGRPTETIKTRRFVIIIILKGIALERYSVIMHPLRSKHSLTNQRLGIVQVAMWSIALVNNIPYIILFDIISFGDSEFCYASSRSTFYLKWLSLVNVIVWYFLPLVLSSMGAFTANIDRFVLSKQSLVLSSIVSKTRSLRRRSVFKLHSVRRERRKVIRLSITVVVSFAICVLPHKLKVIDHYWFIERCDADLFSPVSFIIHSMNYVLNPSSVSVCHVFYKFQEKL
ncbi:TRISR-like protein [Mya arenaria]|uniref:TRISR-like protein n=1 Tax=Mya arenaria TaxID=6604 RepID=A0ABY7FRH2_MYAAR|nr:TRISR-like protein [Mya arenaria]